MMARKPGMAVRGPAQNARVFNRDGWKCVYCGYEGNSPKTYVFLEADHLDPATKTDDDYDPEHDDEKVTACNCCNKLKGNYRPKGATREEKLADARACVQERRCKLTDWFQANYHLSLGDSQDGEADKV